MTAQTDTRRTQIQRLGHHAQARHWDIDATVDGHYVLRYGQCRVSVTYGTSTGLIHDAFAQVLDDNGDPVQRWNIARANDENKLAKVIEYINLA